MAESIPSEKFSDSSSTNEEELRILLIGKTGVGKSALANILIGTEVFQSEPSPESVTNHCQYSQFQRFGRNVLVVDTPGVFDTNHDEEVIMKEIAKCYGLTSPGPHVIIMVRRPDRFTKEEQDTIEIFHKHFGNNLFQYMIMVITNEGTNYKEKTKQYISKTIEIGSKRDQDRNLRMDPTTTLYTVLQNSNHRYLPFNISDSGYEDVEQVKNLLEMIDHLVAENQGKYFTNANYESVEKRLQLVEHISEIQNSMFQNPDTVSVCSYEYSGELHDMTGLLLNDVDITENLWLREMTDMRFQRTPQLPEAQLTGAQSPMRTRGEVRNKLRDDIQKEKKGIIWAIRGVLKAFENAYKWIKQQFSQTNNRPHHNTVVKTTTNV